jgi:hypothetical protein
MENKIVFLAAGLLFWTLAAMFYTNAQNISFIFFMMAIFLTIYGSLQIIYNHDPYNPKKPESEEQRFIVAFVFALTLVVSGIYAFGIFDNQTLSWILIVLGSVALFFLYLYDTFKVVRKTRRKLLFDSVFNT